jgi:endonuclease/exonuclease/phosphatase family metal-dependent hydrolase
MDKPPLVRRYQASDFGALTLNLRFGLADDGARGWTHRKACFPPLFVEYGADFMALQEVNDFQAEFLLEILPDYRMIGQRRPAPKFWQNNVIFFHKRWRCRRKDHFFLSPTPGIPSRFGQSRWPRQCTVGVFECGGRVLACVSTHFDFDKEIQLESARIIKRKLARLTPEMPIILMGDFNTPAGSACYLEFTGAGTDDIHASPREGEGSGPVLTDFANPFPPPFPGTHHGYTGSTHGDQIDWILYRGAIVPTDWGVIRHTVEGIYPSDHFPLYTLFRWGE